MKWCPTSPLSCFFFFFNDTATTEIYTLSLHDALPISVGQRRPRGHPVPAQPRLDRQRSEEHTSELQSQFHLVCRLLLEKKKKTHGNQSAFNEERNNSAAPNKNI